MDKKKLERAELGALHEFVADAVYPRRPRRLGERQAVETLSVDTQFHEFVDDAINLKRSRKLAAKSKKRPAMRRKKSRAKRET